MHYGVGKVPRVLSFYSTRERERKTSIRIFQRFICKTICAFAICLVICFIIFFQVLNKSSAREEESIGYSQRERLLRMTEYFGNHNFCMKVDNSQLFVGTDSEKFRSNKTKHYVYE